MSVTNTISTLTSLSECESRLTIEALSSPLLNAPMSHRINLFRNKKECGTTIPAILYQALKLRYLIDMEEDEETLDTHNDVQEVLRHLLSDVYAHMESKGLTAKTVMVAKTVQKKIFSHLVYKDPLVIEEEDLVIKSKRNGMYTVADNIAPSGTIHSFLAVWMLKSAKLNPDSDFKHINASARRFSREVFYKLEPFERDDWGKFSARLQRALFMKAFSEVFSEEQRSTPLFPDKPQTGDLREG